MVRYNNRIFYIPPRIGSGCSPAANPNKCCTLPRAKRWRTPCGEAATCSRSSRALVLCVRVKCLYMCVRIVCVCCVVCMCVCVMWWSGIGAQAPSTNHHSPQLKKCGPELDERVLPLHQPEQNVGCGALALPLSLWCGNGGLQHLNERSVV